MESPIIHKYPAIFPHLMLPPGLAEPFEAPSSQQLRQAFINKRFGSAFIPTEQQKNESANAIQMSKFAMNTVKFIC